MSKVKHFGDLKTGDIIWKTDTEKWQLIPVKVVKIEPTANISYIRIYLSNRTNFVVWEGAVCYDAMWFWSDYKKAEEKLMEKSIEMEPYYIRKIDSLISQYDNLLKWRKSLEI
jgi:hypothetical protein